jgi:hypothetical protein
VAGEAIGNIPRAKAEAIVGAWLRRIDLEWKFSSTSVHCLDADRLARHAASQLHLYRETRNMARLLRNRMKSLLGRR